MIDVAQLGTLHSVVAGTRTQGATLVARASRAVAAFRSRRALETLPKEILIDLAIAPDRITNAARRAAITL